MGLGPPLTPLMLLLKDPGPPGGGRPPGPGGKLFMECMEWIEGERCCIGNAGPLGPLLRRGGALGGRTSWLGLKELGGGGRCWLDMEPALDGVRMRGGLDMEPAFEGVRIRGGLVMEGIELLFEGVRIRGGLDIEDTEPALDGVRIRVRRGDAAAAAADELVGNGCCWSLGSTSLRASGLDLGWKVGCVGELPPPRVFMRNLLLVLDDDAMRWC